MHLQGGARGVLARGGDRFSFGLARFSLHFRLRRNQWRRPAWWVAKRNAGMQRSMGARNCRRGAYAMRAFSVASMAWTCRACSRINSKTMRVRGARCRRDG